MRSLSNSTVLCFILAIVLFLTAGSYFYKLINEQSGGYEMNNSDITFKKSVLTPLKPDTPTTISTTANIKEFIIKKDCSQSTWVQKAFANPPHTYILYHEEYSVSRFEVGLERLEFEIEGLIIRYDFNFFLLKHKGKARLIADFEIKCDPHPPSFTLTGKKI